MGLELPIIFQTREFFLSAVGGCILGFFYDLLRGLRRIHPRLTLPADFCFAALAFSELLAMGLYVGHGALRLFMLPGMGLGAVLYFYLLSPAILLLWTKLLRRIAGLRKKFLKFMQEFCKITIAFVKSMCKIKCSKKYPSAKEKTGGEFYEVNRH